MYSLRLIKTSRSISADAALAFSVATPRVNFASFTQHKRMVRTAGDLHRFVALPVETCHQKWRKGLIQTTIVNAKLTFVVDSKGEDMPISSDERAVTCTAGDLPDQHLKAQALWQSELPILKGAICSVVTQLAGLITTPAKELGVASLFFVQICA